MYISALCHARKLKFSSHVHLPSKKAMPHGSEKSPEKNRNEIRHSLETLLLMIDPLKLSICFHFGIVNITKATTTMLSSKYCIYYIKF